MPPIFGWFDLTGPKFDAGSQAQTIWDAIEGAGTTEEDLIEVLTSHTVAERQEIRKVFKEKFARDIIEEIEGDTSGNFCKTLVALCKDSAELLIDSVVAANTSDPATVCEILCPADKNLLKKLQDTYKKKENKELADIFGEAGDDLGDLLRGELADKRDKFKKDVKIDQAKIDADAKAIYDAGENKWGTDESKFIEIISARTNVELVAINEAYKKLSKNDLAGAIVSEIGGGLRDALVAIVKCAINRTDFLVDRLYNFMEGAGSDDVGLVRLLVSRKEIDLINIAVEFQFKYKVKLSYCISTETSGYYRDTLLAIIAKLL